MRMWNGRFIVAVGVALTLAGLLAFSLIGSSTTVGLETDVSPPPEVEEPAAPPASIPDEGPEGDVGAGARQPAASLPDAGNGGYLEATGPAGVWLMTLLGALGVTLVGAGVIANRHGRRVRGQ